MHTVLCIMGRQLDVVVFWMLTATRTASRGCEGKTRVWAGPGRDPCATTPTRFGGPHMFANARAQQLAKWFQHPRYTKRLQRSSRSRSAHAAACVMQRCGACFHWFLYWRVQCWHHSRAAESCVLHLFFQNSINWQSRLLGTKTKVYWRHWSPSTRSTTNRMVS